MRTSRVPSSRSLNLYQLEEFKEGQQQQQQQQQIHPNLPKSFKIYHSFQTPKQIIKIHDHNEEEQTQSKLQSHRQQNSELSFFQKVINDMVKVKSPQRSCKSPPFLKTKKNSYCQEILSNAQIFKDSPKRNEDTFKEDSINNQIESQKLNVQTSQSRKNMERNMIDDKKDLQFINHQESSRTYCNFYQVQNTNSQQYQQQNRILKQRTPIHKLALSQIVSPSSTKRTLLGTLKKKVIDLEKIDFDQVGGFRVITSSYNQRSSSYDKKRTKTMEMPFTATIPLSDQGRKVVKFGPRNIILPSYSLKQKQQQFKLEVSRTEHIQSDYFKTSFSNSPSSFCLKFDQLSGKCCYPSKNLLSSRQQQQQDEEFNISPYSTSNIFDKSLSSTSMTKEKRSSSLKFKRFDTVKGDFYETQKEASEQKQFFKEERNRSINKIEYSNEEEKSKKNKQILKAIQNRKNICNLIQLIEESPFNQAISKNEKAEDTQSESKTNMETHETEKEIDSSEEKEVIKQKTNPIDFAEQTKKLEKDKSIFILNHEKMKEFIPISNNKERKNLEGRALRDNLIKILNYLKALKLTPRELLKNKVFSKKPFEKRYSYDLITAAKHNDFIKCQDLLLKNKYIIYDFDYICMTSLHWSCKRGYAKLSQFFIDKGADVNALDILGKSPLYYAAEQGHLEVVKVLLYNKAYPWSTRYITYEKIERLYPLISSALLVARKIHVLLNMTPFNQRKMVWQKKGIAFSQILA